MVCIDSFKLQTMTAFNQKLLRGVQGAVFSKRAPLAAGGKNFAKEMVLLYNIGYG
jgi:hypothetical protein